MKCAKGLVGLVSLLAVAGCSRGEGTAPGFDVVEATIGGIQQAIRDGDTTCHAVVAAYLARIKAYDQPLGINAITVINPRALAVADAIDGRLKAGGELGPLYCAPLLIKDNYDTHDLVTSGGSIALKDSLPPDDAFMVRRLRQADAIVIAKTNMAEWAFSPRETVSSSFGRTVNAYDPGRTPAGSSGGTDSGVAASFAVAGMGSDTGNSIRGPSSHLALFGIRSTIGLTSRDGIIPLAFDRDIAGPMSRTVEDGARIFNVVAGFDTADPLTRLGKGRREADYTKFLDPGGLKGARIGVLRALVDTDDADPEITAIFEQAVADLKAAGAVIVDPFTIAGLDSLMKDDNFCARFRYDMYLYLKSRGGVPFLDVATLLKTGQYTQTPASSSARVKGGLEFFAGFPLDVAPDQWDPPCPTFPDHPGRRAFLDAVVAAMDTARLDAIVYPGWTNPPAPIDTANEDYKGDNSQLIAPATGLPAVTVPMGFWRDRLPAGLQILARPYAEGVLFRLAYAYEQATRHRRPPPGFGALKSGR